MVKTHFDDWELSLNKKENIIDKNKTFRVKCLLISIFIPGPLSSIWDGVTDIRLVSSCKLFSIISATIENTPQFS